MNSQRGRSRDVLVLGAGAAGLMAAIEAGRRGLRVTVLDHAERPGKKILISGGGRCNFTNIHCRPENFLSENPHFARSALAGFTPQDFLELVHRHRIPYHEKTLGQLFCDGSAQAILDLLLEECAAAGVEIELRQKVTAVGHGSGFTVETESDSFGSSAVIVATGGLSIPKMGATGLAYEIARQFGLRVVEPRPALVPLTLDGAARESWCDLAGVSAEVVASTGKQRFREKMLVTHRGLSGPAILQISSYWRQGETVEIDFAPGEPVYAGLLALSAGRHTAAAETALRQVLPQRLAERLLALDPPQGWSNRALEAAEQRLHRWPVVPSGTEGFDKAEVTAGGVATAELSAKTMEAKRVPGLYFIGEAVDVTGHLGGFNFQWAWASGAAAGRAVKAGIRD
ncbi:NAD(P)/FAD-dependent oxidoreductase [Paracidobacterium acidisoli]|uniref:NAD(P)/FAD-dependent oxidoreductase n=1 Tax=Paracidobacterium acidisoli TaxID=2303751 RepID=UPI003315DF84